MILGWYIELLDGPLPDGGVLIAPAPLAHIADLSLPQLKIHSTDVPNEEFLVEHGEPAPDTLTPTLRITNRSGLDWPQYAPLRLIVGVLAGRRITSEAQEIPHG